MTVPQLDPGRIHEVTASDASLRRFLHGLPPVDAAGVEERAAQATATILADPALLDRVIRVLDLTTLEATDTPEAVRALCDRARHPDPEDASVPHVAAVCVYPDLVGAARQFLAGTGVRAAAVAGAFPSGRAMPTIKLAEIRQAVTDGAQEIDTVLDRGAFLSGRYLEAYEQLAAARHACAPADPGIPAVTLKVILETGELGMSEVVCRAAWLAMLAGADFVKTSTGKIPAAATPPMTLVMMEAARAFHAWTGRPVGVKAAGGIRTTGQALVYLRLAEETAGPGGTGPGVFRLGASSLLGDLLSARRRSGAS